MRFHALAVDFDGTLAHDSVVDQATLEALGRLRKSGRRAILVTGRILEDLAHVFDHLDTFDAIVAENGAMLYDPATKKMQALAGPPPPAFVDALRAKGVTPVEPGHVIVGCWHPYEDVVLETIREQGLDLAVIFNKGAVMVLPSNVNKASGLKRQLEIFHLSPHNVAGIGDGENDLAFLALCEASAAVANALPSVKNQSDIVTEGDHGRGVCELIDQMIENDLRGADAVDRRHRIALGKADGDHLVDLPAGCRGILLAGRSGGGKSSFVTGFLERIAADGYQYCAIDPEGDFTELEGTIAFGDEKAEPNLEAVEQLILENGNAVVLLLAIKVEDRPAYARKLLSRIAELRARYGRPHWLIVDEAHHLLPAEAQPEPPASETCGGTFYVTTRPELVARDALACVEAVIAVGDDPAETIESARGILGLSEPRIDVTREHLHKGRAVLWERSEPGASVLFDTIPETQEHRRHRRKYAQGELAEEKSFYFTGPHRKLHLRAQNLMLFVQLAEGVDDETWTYHLRRHDYSRWVHDAIGDDHLADTVRAVEDEEKISPREGRARIAEAVRSRYTAPA